MSENDGERELVLGNKQLLGIFFVATLLCGVFFAMGYVVGGNSAKLVAVPANSDSGPAPVSDDKREEPKAPTAQDGTSTTSTTGDANNPMPEAEPKVADNPAAAGAQPPAQAVPEPKQLVKSEPDVKPPAAAATASGISVSVPEKGASYVQVIATPRPHADDLVKIMRQAGLPAIMAKSSKPELFEVLVGPYRSSLSLKEAKDKLKGLGFDGITVKKQ